MTLGRLSSHEHALTHPAHAPLYTPALADSICPSVPSFPHTWSGKGTGFLMLTVQGQAVSLLQRMNKLITAVGAFSGVMGLEIRGFATLSDCC